MNREFSADVLEALNAISPLAVIGLDEKGQVDLWNAAAAELFVWPESEVAGHPLPAPLQALADSATKTGPSTVTVTAKDGREIAVELRAARRGRGVLITAADRSQAVAQERERLELTRFRELLEAAPDAIIEVAGDGEIALLNRATEKLFGYTRDELLGRNVDLLVPAELMGNHAEHRARYCEHPATRPMGHDSVLRARRKDGTEFPAEISLSPVRTGSGFRVTAIIRDVTAQRKAEEEIRTANRQLELRNGEIEQANALKSEFLASMSHELRTPLHTILGFTELLQEGLDGPLNQKQMRYVQHVHRDSVHLLELINDILDLSKIEAGRLDLHIEAVDAAEVAGTTVDSMREAAEAKGLVIDNNTSAPLFVQADRVRFQEILSNLLSNAIKFTPEGGHIAIESARAGDDMVEIAVADTGIGISPADQKVIFDKFRQVGSTTKGVREGTGLGLAIVKSLVEIQGGQVTLESAPGRGSRFAFTIPADPSHPGAEPVVLIIEDEPSARELLCSYLDPLGIRTECAATGEEGLRKARQLRPDAIMLDLLLPGTTGWRVLEDLRAGPDTQSVPVFVTSVLDYDRRAITRGATGYLQKPLKKEALLRTLREQVPDRFGSI